MQRVFDLLKDESPVPQPGETAWILGCSYDDITDTWSEEFLTHVCRLIWMMYRTQFATPIPRHPDGPSPLLQNMNAFIRAGPYAVQASSLVDSFTSDVGWGCMIRTGQSLLANALLKLYSNDCKIELKDLQSHDEIELLRKFSDGPDAPYSIHRFVEYGAEKCGKLPGQWFGPSAVAACISHFAEPPLSVYVSSGADIFEQDLLALKFPILVLCGLRLGIQEVNSVYYNGLRNLITASQSVGIAGGRTSASHYFYGVQGTRLFYHDPHEPKPSLRPDSNDQEFIESMHSNRLRSINFEDMDPSMLVGFLLTSKQDFEQWKMHINEIPENGRVINFTSEKPTAAFLDDLSDEESIRDETVAPPESDQPTDSSKHTDTTQENKMRSSGYVVCEPIAQEAIVTVDVNEPGDESTVEVTNPVKNQESLQ